MINPTKEDQKLIEKLMFDCVKKETQKAARLPLPKYGMDIFQKLGISRAM